MRITTLIENCQDDSKKLAYEHGLSLYIEKNDKIILFDTGKTGAFIDNAETLGVNIQDIDMVVLSHGHYDHSGGLLAFFKKNKKALVYMKREASQDFFFKFCFSKRNIGTDKKVFVEHAARIKYIDCFSEISDGIFIITDIERKYATPISNKYLFVRKGRQIVRDDFNHELIVAIKENDGLTVFTGCSHNGLNNMIQAVRTVFQEEKIKAVIGGFHLMQFSKLKFLGASQTEVADISRKLLKEGVDKIYTGHCTGKDAFKKLKIFLGDKIAYLKTGTVIDL